MVIEVIIQKYYSEGYYILFRGGWSGWKLEDPKTYLNEP